MAKPDFYPFWATDDMTLPAAGTPNKVRPATVIRGTGYDKDQKPACQEWNWQFNNIYEWIKYIDETMLTTGSISMETIYPVGCIYYSTVSTNPNTLFGMGTWIAIGAGRVLIGNGSTTDENGTVVSFTADTTGGEFTTGLTEAQLPSHKHLHPYRQQLDDVSPPTWGYSDPTTAWDTDDSSRGNSAQWYTSPVGSGQLHDNIQPYYVVYIWERTA